MKFVLLFAITFAGWTDNLSANLSYVKNNWQQLPNKYLGTEQIRLTNDATGLSVATTAGTTFVKFDGTNQRIGLGIVSPTAKLQIEEDTDDHLKLTYPGVASYNYFVNALGDMDIKKDVTSRLFIDTNGKVGLSASSPRAKLDIGNGAATYTTGTPVLALSDNATAYYPEVQSTNRTYVHFKGSGNGAAFNVGINGHQVGNPGAANWARVGASASTTTVAFLSVEDDGVAFYSDGSKSAGAADYTPTKRFEVTAAGAVNVAGDSITVQTTQSPGSADACTAGEIAWDASYIYVCTASGAWKRAALTGGY